MKVYRDIAQGSVDWQILRSGKITASEVDALISPLGEIRRGEGVTTYLSQKLCERWTGGPLMSLQGVFDCEQGIFLEERAKPAFTLHTGIDIENVSFIETDDGRAGCSPDGIIGKESGVELKAPRTDTHLRYLLSGKLPKIYVSQVQFSMFVTGCKTWHFFSYNRSLPPLHLVVERDEKFHESLGKALSAFLKAMDDGWNRICELNGGPPQRRKVSAPAPTPEPAMADVIP